MSRRLIGAIALNYVADADADGYSLGPVILGVVLFRLLDDDWRRAIISDREDLGRFFWGRLSSPLSATLFAAVILIFVSQTPAWRAARIRLFGKAAA